MIKLLKEKTKLSYSEILNIFDTVFQELNLEYQIVDATSLWIHFPELYIASTKTPDNKHLMKNLFVELRGYRNTVGVFGMRTSVSNAEFNSGYAHSHLGGNSYVSFSDFCLGSTYHPFSALFTSEMSIQDSFKACLLQLIHILQIESTATGPYRKISNITLPENGGVGNNKISPQQLKNLISGVELIPAKYTANAAHLKICPILDEDQLLQLAIESNNVIKYDVDDNVINSFNYDYYPDFDIAPFVFNNRIFEFEVYRVPVKEFGPVHRMEVRPIFKQSLLSLLDTILNTHLKNEIITEYFKTKTPVSTGDPASEIDNHTGVSIENSIPVPENQLG